MANNRFKILTFDGGGIRGVFAAHILKRISDEIGEPAGRRIDFLAGTSTGSILATAVACEIEPDKVISMYRDHGPKIFKLKGFLPRKVKPVIRSKYSGKALASILDDVFGDKRLGDISKPLMIPATDIGNGNVHVFKSSYSAEFVRDKNVLVREAVQASCSAPTFFDPMISSNYHLADGGLWANNPALAAVIDAQRRLNVDLADIDILSIGTGTAKTCYGMRKRRRWGFLNGWGNSSFIDFLLSLQSQSINNYLHLLLSPAQIIRVDFESDQPLPLDDCSAVNDLISRADKFFTHNSERILNFIRK